MGNTVTFYGEDATRFIDLMHKYGAFRQEPEDPPRWDAAKVERVAKGLTDKQREAVLLLDGTLRRGWMSSRGSSHSGTRTLCHVGAIPEPMIYINGRVSMALDRYGLLRHWYESDRQTALTENGKAVLDYLKELSE